MSHDYKVTFVGDWFTTAVNLQDVEGDDWVAIDLAANMLMNQYGWDMKAVSTIAIDAERA